MAERRRQYYTDQKIQGYLLVALIAIEVGLVCMLLVFLYTDINSLIEQQIYRIHGNESGTWPQIFKLVVSSMSVFLVINIVLLYFAHKVWSRYIKVNISEFSSVLDRIIQRDFTSTPVATTGRHKMMKLARQWFNKEQQRGVEINTLLELLSGYEDAQLTEEIRDQVKKAVQDYRQLVSIPGS